MCKELQVHDNDEFPFVYSYFIFITRLFVTLQPTYCLGFIVLCALLCYLKFALILFSVLLIFGFHVHLVICVSVILLSCSSFLLDINSCNCNIPK